ncbi:MAG TPA: GAF domain-containing sensor histidine kinase [Anaeromyxobacteraceae bacterium]|nr:GAF domain-containing sensor histidine kinase [Anaeromyxobacteraceae bacterium]
MTDPSTILPHRLLPPALLPARQAADAATCVAEGVRALSECASEQALFACLVGLLAPRLADAARVELLGEPPSRDGSSEDFAVVPLGVPGLALGQLTLEWREPDPAARPTVVAIAEALCGAAALALANLRHREREERARRRVAREEEQAAAAHRRLELLDGVASLVGSSLDGDALLEGLRRVMVPALGDQVCFSLCGAADGAWQPGSGGAELAVQLRSLFGADPLARVRHVVQTGEPALSQAPARGEGEREGRVESALVVRLTARGRVAGAMVLLSYDPARRYGAPELAAAEDLAGRVAMSLDNARLYREAQEAVRVREEFLSVASHELRTPLSALRLNVQSVARGVARGALDRAALMGRMKSAERQTDRLARLIEKLLDISRITSGKLVLQLEELDLAAVTGEAVTRALEETRGDVPIHFSMEGDLVATSDRLRLDQVVTNLLSNALKYGGGKPVEVRIRAEGARARLSVRDHGIGIDPVDQQRIFGRFERAVAGHHYGGLGLGLWIVRQIVEALGGDICVESAPGGGSTFTVLLPLQRQAAAPGADAALAVPTSA